jgi:hypothetical protein
MHRRRSFARFFWLLGRTVLLKAWAGYSTANDKQTFIDTVGHVRKQKADFTVWRQHAVFGTCIAMSPGRTR